MKHKLLLGVALLASATFATATTGIFGSYINVSSSNHGGSTVWYDLTPPGGGRASNPSDLEGFSFGSFDPSMAGTLNLTGVETLTYKDGGGDVTGVQFNYRVYLQSASPGAFTTQTVGWTANSSFQDAAGTTYTGGGDQKWSNTSSWQPVNLLTGLSNGDYYLEVFTKAFTNEGDRYHNVGGANYKASFTVVPEAATSLLGGLGLLLLLRRRR